MVRSILGLCIPFIVIVTNASAAAAETSGDRCRALSGSGAREAAIAACDEALKLAATAEDLWAAASVRVSRTEVPTMDDFIRADLLAAAATRLAPGEPWGYLAHFEIAYRWGDPELIAKRLRELERVAPAHPKTALARASVASSPSSALAFSLVLACLIVLTGAHAASRWLRRRAGARGPEVAVIAALLWLAMPRAAQAADFAIDDADPERGVPSAAEADARPIDFGHYLQELSERAEAATGRGDHAAAVRYYRALVRAVPDSSVSFRQLCSSLVKAGDRNAAVVACKAALALPGVRAEDFVRFGDLVLAKHAATPGELADVDAAARHLVGQPDTRVIGWQLQCRLAVRVASAALLEECSTGLAAARPDDATTHVYQWSLAMQRGNSREARRHVEQARAAGLDAQALARMSAATPPSQQKPRRILLAAGLVVAVAGLVLLAVRARRLRRGHTQWTTTI